MKKLVSILLLLISNHLYAQANNQQYLFGRITQADYELKVYEKDSTANAIFLYEDSKISFKQVIRNSKTITTYRAKIKIFNKEGVDHATIKIPFKNTEDKVEVVRDIKGITHNGLIKTELTKENIFKVKVNDYLSEVKFTMPNIKDHSIIQYEYTIESPFRFNFIGWEFQSNIPKLYSEFYALIPLNYTYNRRLNGNLKLLKNQVDLKKDCFTTVETNGFLDCEELTYAMNDIPAFIEEDYMPSKKDYFSSIKFELSKFQNFDGKIYTYTKTWEDIDKKLMTEQNLGNQLKKIGFIKKQLPAGIIEGKNNLEKAKKTYHYIKDYFTWNNSDALFNDVKIKNAFNKKSGNSSEINIALTNALNAVGFDCEIMLISTRKNGLPTKTYPVMTDFNYIIAKLNLDGEIYLLDATDKRLPFGMLPYRTLNGYGRAMSLNKASYWYNIKSNHATRTRVLMSLKLDKSGNFDGTMNVSNSGYHALSKRKEYLSIGKNDYLSKIENENLYTITSYDNNNLNAYDKPFAEAFEIKIKGDSLNKQIVLLKPFIINQIKENPFKLKNRMFPLDFAHIQSNIFSLQIDIPQGYEIKDIPDNIVYKLPNGGGIYQFYIENRDNKIILHSKIILSKSFFTPEEYPYLKEFYNQILKTQNSLISLEKKQKVLGY